VSVEPFLIAQFRQFYREVLRLRGEVERVAPPLAGDLPAAEGPGRPAPGETPGTPRAVGEELQALFERQAAAARRSGGEYSGEVYREAQYVMAALADETFLHLDWPGREGWQSNLLESRLFASHRAGTAVFQRIDALLQSRDPIYVDLAKVYLMALALGFQGRYRGSDGARLDGYRRDLFAFVANREPDLLDGERRLFPATYAGVLDRGEEQRLPYLRPWLLLSGLVFFAWLGVSHHLWRRLVEDLAPLISQILARS
jgi:type VI secretion system protein ImpK